MFKLDDQARLFGSTAVENLFFTEYLPNATGDQVRIYLLGLYHSHQGMAEYGIVLMAKELGLEESQVEAALRYWERRRLVERISDKPLQYVFHNLGQRLLTGQDSMQDDKAFITFSDAVYT